MDFDETNVLDQNMKRIKAEGERSKDEGKRIGGGRSRHGLVVKIYF